MACEYALVSIPFCRSTSAAALADTIPVYAGFDDISPSKHFCMIVGDTQRTSCWEFWRERNNRERKLVAEEIARSEPALLMHLGDLTTSGSSFKHWQDFDVIQRSLIERKIPVFPILGNHDLYGNDVTALQNYFARFPHLESRRWYSFTWKNIAFLMADSNFSALVPDQLREQYAWYRAELARFDADNQIEYIIVCCHEPPFTNSRVVSPNEKSKEYFAAAFCCAQKTVFFFSGHGHTYERFEIAGKFFIVSGGGGGPRHKVRIDPGKQRHRDLFIGARLRAFHFCRIELCGETIKYAVFGLQPDYTFSIVDSLVVT